MIWSLLSEGENLYFCGDIYKEILKVKLFNEVSVLKSFLMFSIAASVSSWDL